MTSETIAVSIHGPMGVLDLVVPPGIAAVDIAREYAEQSGLASIPLIYSASGDPLRPDAVLADHGVGTGTVLVATTSVHRAAAPARPAAGRPVGRRPGGAVVVLFAIAATLAALAGWYGGHADPGPTRDAVLGALAVASLL